MIKLLPLLSLLLLVSPIFAQQEENKIFFSDALSLHLPKYESNAENAYSRRDYKEATRLFDSLVEYGLNGSYMNNFQFNQLNSKEVSLYDFKKPTYLITYASWCVTTEGEIPAINELANKYSDEIDFVILFWDDQKTTKKMAKSYNKNITVLYVNELNNRDAHVVSKLKHSLGLPTTFLLDKDKMVLDVRRGVTHALNKSFEESFDLNYTSMYDGIANHLLGNKKYSTNQETVATN
ncbi:thiol-disulfide isomerase/thioredoxin [Gillisia sp. Hel_I_86]|uniref:TlpA family protein disulfide reductase n=1 Tax=Gillisia sp. Hel_I_86 TaxID=1249981 RepID=UPI001199F764|nr:TlpA disulfide reductase family protein [Gillisia sp. Hel_I_86]TVZ27732.1 thiol-disulfide isomerase/thioredoxin [Gillisia sp. Hel_I_86]